MSYKKNVLDLKIRREIYDLISDYPGLHLRELSRRTDTSFGSLRYHLDFLKRKELVTTKIDSRYTRFYAKEKVGVNDKKIISVLRQEVPLRIVLLLLTPGPGNVYISKETQEKAYKDPSTFDKTYSSRELAEFTKYWNGIYDGLFNLKKHRTTIDFHLNKLEEIDVIEKISIGKETKYKLKDQDDMWAFLIRYRDALSTDSMNFYMVWREIGLKYDVNNAIDEAFDIFPHPYHA